MTRCATLVRAWATCVLVSGLLVGGTASAAKGAKKGGKTPPTEVKPPADDAPESVPAKASSESGSSGVVPMLKPPSEEDEPRRRFVNPEKTHLEMAGLEEKLSDLKEEVFRTKARLVLLNETVLGTGLRASRATIVHRNEMGPSFLLEKVTYDLDGKTVFSREDRGDDLDLAEEIEVWTGSVTNSEHRVDVELVYRGRGFGIFAYLNKYQFRVKSSYVFRGTEGKHLEVNVIGYEKDVEALEDRPGIRFELGSVDAEPPEAGPDTGDEKKKKKKKKD